MAVSQYYVDPTINANSGTGTSGDPFGDLQYALNTITRNATDGDQINVKAGTAEVLAASLSLATYGTPTEAAPLIIRGYTTAANDGGIGEINNGGANIAIFNSSTLPINFVDMKIGNCGTAAIVTAGPGSRLIGCEIWGSTGSPAIFLYGSGTAINYICGCYIRDITAVTPIRVGSGNTIAGVIHGNLISVVAGPGVFGAVYVNGYHAVLVNNVVNLLTGSATGAYGIYAERAYNVIVNNTVRRVAGGTAAGIAVMNGPSFVANNILENWSGTGGNGIYDNSTATRSVAAANAGYNNTTNLSVAGKEQIVMSAMTSLAASPFVNAAGGNFNLNGSITGVTEAAWPTAWPGYTPGTTPMADVGAVQAGAGAAPDYPAEADVRLGVGYDSAAKTGTLDLPAVADVQSGVTFDGATKTGTFAAPAVGDVQSGVTYGAAAEFTGTFAVPDEAQVESGVGFGAGGTEFNGTLVATGAADWTAGEKEQIRQALGITGTKAATSGGNLDSLVAVAPDNKPTVSATGEASANVTLWAGDAVAGAPALEATTQAILEDTGTTLPAAIAAVDSDVWSYATRTLTQSSTSTTDSTAAGSIARRRGDSWSISLTIGAITGYTSLWFSAKWDRDNTDAMAVLQIKLNASGLNDGLLYVNGAAATDDTLGSITVSDASTGAIVIAVDETITDDLPPAGIYYDVQVLNAGTVSTLDSGTLTITADVTRAVA